MAEENSIKNLALPVLLAGGIGAGGTGIVSNITDDQTVVNSTTIESCREFIQHGKNHQRHEDDLAMVYKELEIIKTKLECKQ